MQKTLSSDTFSQILKTFRQFERKLDKLQDDVSYHGQTLTDLRVMVANLPGSALRDAKIDNVTVQNKTTTVDNQQGSAKTKRKSPVQSAIQSKLATKVYQTQKYKSKPATEQQVAVKKMASFPKSSSKSKRVVRQRKSESPRKATLLRPKKVLQKKTKSQQQNYEIPLIS